MTKDDKAFDQTSKDGENFISSTLLTWPPVGRTKYFI